MGFKGYLGGDRVGFWE